MSDRAATASRSRALSLILIAVGALLVLVAQSMTWAVAATAVAGASIPLDGSVCLPAGRAVALLALAAVGGLLAARGAARLLISALLVGVSLVTLAGLLRGPVLGGLADVAATLPRAIDGSVAVIVDRSTLPLLLSVLGLVAVLLGGLLALVAPGGWSGLGRRFEQARPDPVVGAVAEPASRPSDPVTVWQALDRGEDPTG